MKVLVFTDLQSDEGSERRRTDPSTPLQRWRVQQFYRWAACLAQEKQVDAVWDLGDTTHNRNALPLPTIQVVTQGCAELTAGMSPLLNFKLLGNHEQHLKNQESHVGNLFTPYFHVVQDRAIFHWPSKHLVIVCASYASDSANLVTWLEKALPAAGRDGAKVILLGHFTVEGAKAQAGTMTGGVRRDLLEQADLVLLGHIHRRQKIGEKIHYIGSPFQQDFGEAHDPTKCVAILDTTTLDLEWIPTPFPGYRTVDVESLASATRGDDVVRVMVRSADEAQRLYASSEAGTVEPVYAFDAAPVAGAPAAGELDFESLSRAYVATVPLPGVTTDELLRAADELR